MNQFENHVDYVTGQVKTWYETVMPHMITKWVNEIRAMNAEVGNEPEDSWDEDIEYLAGNLEDFAVRQLVDSSQSIVRNLLSDALSETDWPELAMHYLHPEGS